MSHIQCQCLGHAVGNITAELSMSHVQCQCLGHAVGNITAELFLHATRPVSVFGACCRKHNS